MKLHGPVRLHKVLRRIISILLENESGALSRVAALFSARGYNIESLTVAPTDDDTLSRMTIVTVGSEHIIEQITKQLNKLIDVVEASDISEKNTVWRELALIKVSCKPSQRVEILELSKIFRVNVVDVGINNMTFEIAGGKSKIDSFVELLDQFGVLEIMRTGRIATLRGTTKVGLEDGEFSVTNQSNIYISDENESGSV